MEYYGYKYVIEYYKAKIGKIQIEEYAKKFKRYTSRITYMLEETGIGTGIVWSEEMLFSTENEAREFCDKYIPSDGYSGKPILKEG